MAIEIPNTLEQALDMMSEDIMVAASVEGQYFMSLVDLELQDKADATLADPEHRGPYKQCFFNAWSAALNDRITGDGRYTYTEGYALSPNSGMWVHHGWLTDEETGFAVETTWDAPAEAYVGVRVYTLSHLLIDSDADDYEPKNENWNWPEPGEGTVMLSLATVDGWSSQEAKDAALKANKEFQERLRIWTGIETSPTIQDFRKRVKDAS